MLLNQDVELEFFPQYLLFHQWPCQQEGKQQSQWLSVTQGSFSASHTVCLVLSPLQPARVEVKIRNYFSAMFTFLVFSHRASEKYSVLLFVLQFHLPGPKKSMTGSSPNEHDYRSKVLGSQWVWLCNNGLGFNLEPQLVQVHSAELLKTHFTNYCYCICHSLHFQRWLTEIFLGLLSFLIWHKLILDWTTHSLWKKRWFTGKCGWGFPILSSCAISLAEWKKWICWWKRWLAGTLGLSLGAWGAQSAFFYLQFRPSFIIAFLDDRVPPYKRFLIAFL